MKIYTVNNFFNIQKYNFDIEINLNIIKCNYCTDLFNYKNNNHCVEYMIKNVYLIYI